MSRLEITSPNQAQLMIEELYKDLERRIESSPRGLCPVDMTRAFLRCVTPTCGNAYHAASACGLKNRSPML